MSCKTAELNNCICDLNAFLFNYYLRHRDCQSIFWVDINRFFKRKFSPKNGNYLTDAEKRKIAGSLVDIIKTYKYGTVNVGNLIYVKLTDNAGEESVECTDMPSDDSIFLLTVTNEFASP